MFRRPTKKQLLIRRIVVAIVMTVSVAVIVTGTILFVLGYRLDSERGSLTQGVLVQFDSTPSGADVTIDGKIVARTPAKRSLLAGHHTFSVTRNGYQPWNKSLELTPGTLTWLDYIRLVPANLKNETVLSYPTVYGQKASPDFKWLLVQERADTPSFHVVDLRSQEVKTSTIVLPDSIYSEAGVAGVSHRFTLKEWDKGGRYALLSHTFGDQTEWLVVDTQNVNQSVNISRSLGITVSQPQFASTNGTILYGLVDGVVRKLDIGAGTISRGLVSNVHDFAVYDTNIITYVGADPADSLKRVAGVYRDGDATSHVLATITTPDVPIFIDTTTYFGDAYVAISEGANVSILKGRYPTSSQAEATSLEPFASFTAASPLTALSFSPEGDYLLAQTGSSFIGYELEHRRQTNAAAVESTGPAPQLQWLDDAYVWGIYNDSLVIREFDGANTRVIGAATAGLDATLSQNGRYLYSMVKSGDAYHLQRVKMILE